MSVFRRDVDARPVERRDELTPAEKRDAEALADTLVAASAGNRDDIAVAREAMRRRLTGTEHIDTAQTPEQARAAMIDRNRKQ